MNEAITIGLDLAKSVFQVHGFDAGGGTVIRRQLRRRYVLSFLNKQPTCLVGIEACATSHHWAREIAALGHTARHSPAPPAGSRRRRLGACIFSLGASGRRVQVTMGHDGGSVLFNVQSYR